MLDNGEPRCTSFVGLRVDDAIEKALMLVVVFVPAEAMRRTFRTVNPLLNLEPSWKVAPTQMAPVVRRHPETGERHCGDQGHHAIAWWGDPPAVIVTRGRLCPC